MYKKYLLLLGVVAFFSFCKPAEQTSSPNPNVTTTTAATETSAAPTTATPAAIPPYPQIVQQANEIFKHSLPGAFTFVATGSPQSGVATNPSQLTNWVFIATNKSGYRMLLFENGQFGQPTPINGWLGIEFIPLPQGTILLQQAIDILNQKGFTHGFTSVAMGTPVVPNAQPMYWFCVDKQTQGISASTGEYFPNLFPCEGASNIQLPKKP